MSFIFLEYFGISRWEELFFFRTNFLSESGVSWREESNIIFREKWASYLGILLPTNYFFYFPAIITFIFFEIHILPLLKEKREWNGTSRNYHFNYTAFIFDSYKLDRANIDLEA